MKTTLDLLYQVMNLGFDKEKAIERIDASLDAELGLENRKNLSEEELPEKLFQEILFGFECEAEWK